MALADDALMQNLLGVAQLLALLALDVTHRYAGHLGHNVAYGILLQLLGNGDSSAFFCKGGHFVVDLCRCHGAVEQVEGR